MMCGETTRGAVSKALMREELWKVFITGRFRNLENPYLKGFWVFSEVDKILCPCYEDMV